jgi:putative heme-binding domain-containing protein
MFAVGQCYKCHRIAGEGGSVGPDLTAAGRRFKIHDLLETLIVPSKEVSDQYQATIFQLEDGRTISGRIANLSGDRYMVQTDMLDPGNFTNINVKQIEAMKPSTVSMMPTGLLDTMNRDDVLDLLAYLRSVSGTAMGQGGPHGN